MKYLFLHVPKTAGTSLRKGLLSQFTEGQVAECYGGNDEVALLMQRAVESDKKLIYGHLNFGHLKETGIPAAYKLLAFVRHPVQRCISTYIHFLHDHDKDRRHEVKDMGGFEGYLESSFGNNFLSQYFAGTVHQDPQEEPSVLLAKAQKNLDRLDWVGVTERYTESLISLQSFMQLKPISVLNSNPSHDKMLKAELEEKYFGEIVKRNQVDIKLWEIANERLDLQLKSVPFVPLKKLRYNLLGFLDR